MTPDPAPNLAVHCPLSAVHAASGFEARSSYFKLEDQGVISQTWARDTPQASGLGPGHLCFCFCFGFYFQLAPVKSWRPCQRAGAKSVPMRTETNGSTVAQPSTYTPKSGVGSIRNIKQITVYLACLSPPLSALDLLFPCLGPSRFKFLPPTSSPENGRYSRPISRAYETPPQLSN